MAVTQRHPASDQVPENGPWQTDQELRRLWDTYISQRTINTRGQPQQAQDASLALQRYIDANRGQLGIPDNYTLDDRTGGQTLYDPNQNQLRNAAITGISGAAGGYGLSAALSGPAAGGAGSVAPSLAEAAVNPAGTVAPGVANLTPALSTSTAPGVQSAAQSGTAHTGVTSQVAGKTGLGGFLSKLDPTAMLLSGLSLFGGSGDPFQKRTGFTGQPDPVAAVTSYLDAVKSLGSTLARRQPQSLSPVELGTPHPVSIPGVPFQIGGGLGTDPSLKARLEPQGLAQDPFGGPTASSGARRRQP